MKVPVPEAMRFRFPIDVRAALYSRIRLSWDSFSHQEYVVLMRIPMPNAQIYAYLMQ